MVLSGDYTVVRASSGAADGRLMLQSPSRTEEMRAAPYAAAALAGAPGERTLRSHSSRSSHATLGQRASDGERRQNERCDRTQ